jgi:hypothetical protein
MSVTLIRAFRPLGTNKTVNLVVTAVAAQLTIPDSPLGVRALRIANVGTTPIFIEFGDTTTTASVTTSMPILANTVEVFTLDYTDTIVSAIAAGAGSTMYITYGEGL